MPFIMHGNWTVAVKEKNAAFPQRFVVSGATQGNGHYVAPHAPVNVGGDTWSLCIQSDPTGAGGWTDSEYQITFPVKVGSQHQFDLQSNDVWAGDKDFNDLVLTLSAPVTETDFLLYGHVSSYTGCWFNPCYPDFLLIETDRALAQARQHYGMRDILDKYYPREVVRWPIPMPDPPPDVPGAVVMGQAFKPLLIPLQSDTRLPPQKARVVKNTVTARKSGAKSSAAAASESLSQKSSRTVSLYQPPNALQELNKAALAQVAQAGRKFCQVEPLVNAGLSFLEYDRTDVEKLGGDYSGEGARSPLGISSTDRNGNYVFYFHCGVDWQIDEGDLDVALGEDEHLEKLPDVIVQVLGATLPDGKQYETVPYWNIPVLKHINICLPGAYWHTPPSNGCHGNPISHIGYIPVNKPSTVTLDEDGRVTCTDTSKADIPQACCAAWRGYLRMSACLGKYDQVPQYTLEYRTKAPGDAWDDGAWQIYKQPLNLDNWNTTLGEWKAKPVGPSLHTLELTAGSPSEVLAYDNVQGNMDWSGPDWFVKAIIPSWLYNDPSGPGPVQFRLKGYDAAGKQVVNDQITLFIDNTPPEWGFTTPTIGTPTPNPCPLFTLTGAQLTSATLDFKFKMLHRQGFLDSYTLGLNRCNSGDYPVKDASPNHHILHEPNPSAVPAHAPCVGDQSWTFGTLSPYDPQADADGYVAVQLRPEPPAPWLADGELLTILTLKLSAMVRSTNGLLPYPLDYGTIYYNLVIQRDPAG